MKRIPVATKTAQNPCLITSRKSEKTIHGSVVWESSSVAAPFSSKKIESLKIDSLDLIIDTGICKNCDRVEKQQ